MSVSFNRSPYYDDYDKTKKFYRVLYRPEYAVQARELTQQQTILQKQVERFGNHIFKNGAMVIPGQISLDTNTFYVKINSIYSGTEVTESLFLNKKIIGQTSGVIAEVIFSSDVTDTDPKTLYIKYEDAGSGNYQNFLDGEIIKVNGEEIYCVVQGSATPETFDSTGKCSVTSIESGIYFYNGFFIIVDKQSIVLDKYNNKPTKKVGLRLYEYLVTPEEDSTLNDNAQGSDNYAAPGAHRYKLDLVLTAYDVDATIPDDFIELQRLDSGFVVNEIRTSQYNELEKNLARRTFDESGNYTISPFKISIREHLRDPSVPRLADGKYLVADGGDDTKIAIGIEPGKAYVQGYERVKLATTWLESDKARDFATGNNLITNFNIGQYVYVDQMYKIPNFTGFIEVDLWDTASTDGASSGTKIGSARVRAIELVDKAALFQDSVYKLYLFDIDLTADYAWSEVLWISFKDDPTQFTCNPTVGGDYVDLDNRIIEPSKKPNIFRLPYNYTKSLKPGGASDTTYTVQKVYTAAVTTNTVTLDAGPDSVFDTYDGSNYIIMDTAATDSTNAYIDISPSDVTLVSGGSTVEITNIAVANVIVLIPVIRTVISEKIKTLQTNRIITIATPNTVTGKFDVLDRADGFRLVSVVDSSTGDDLTDNYMFDDGQRDAFYDLARIQLKSSGSAPGGSIDVTFDYFSHSSGDYCSVDSYSINYEDIPIFYGEDGAYNLTDCIDFRPVIDSTGLAFTGSGGIAGNLPEPKSNIRTDCEYYLSRIDKIYIDYTGQFEVVKGIPALDPRPPKSVDSGMLLFELRYKPYTLIPSTVRTSFIGTNRYTMKDIRGLEDRIANLEYYTSLSLLEKETAQLQVLDDNNVDRFKNGFIVEPFKSHEIGDALSFDYRCSIDPVEEKMRPSFTMDSIKLDFDETGSTGIKKTGNLVTLPFTHSSFITQSLASTFENVNPFAIRDFEGQVSFQPDSDDWYDTERNGELVVNNDAHYEALQFIADNGVGLNGTDWNSWETQWSSTDTQTTVQEGREVDMTRPHSDFPAEMINQVVGGTGQVRDTTTTINVSNTTRGEARTGTRTTSTPQTIRQDLGDRTVGINYIPYMRSITVLVKVTAMKPNVLLYPFFDDIDVTDYCTPTLVVPIDSKTGNFSTKDGSEEQVSFTSGGTGIVLFQSSTELHIVNVSGTINVTDTITGTTSGATASISSSADLTVPAQGDQIKSDSSGKVSLVFQIPNNSTVKFRTGEREFVLSDQSNTTESVQTSARGLFKSVGQNLQQEGTILSTKTIRFNQEPVSQSRTTTSTTATSNTSVGAWYDPLAQTILVEERGGCFVTKCDFYFKNKDPKLPVHFQIREVVNGYPSTRIVPYSEVTLYPEDVEVSADASVATTFETEAPVYLQQGGEYALVLLSDSFVYNVWIAEMGLPDLKTDELISKQPYNGVLFKSQNASAWTASQNQDLKFKLYKASFNIDIQGFSYFNNESLSKVTLSTNPLLTTINSPIVRVFQKAHGLTPNSSVTLSGFSGTLNGIDETTLNGTHTVTNIEMDSYTIDLGTSGAEVTVTGRTGGSLGVATRNLQMDVMRPNIAEIVLPFTASAWSSRTTSGKSINGTQTPYVKETTYIPTSPVSNNLMDFPKLIASQENEDLFMAGAKSLQFRNVMASNNKNVSPVIDLNRTSCIAVANRIDSPEAGTHYNYTTESESSGGSAIAKYLTKKITLDEPAISVKILLTAVVIENSSFDIWYRKLSPSETTLLNDKDWTEITSPDDFVPLSEDVNDFREYEYTLDFLPEEEFTSIAIKIVMRSTDSTVVPVFNDVRVICLAT